MNSSAPTVNNATKPTVLNQILHNLDLAMSTQNSIPLSNQAQVAINDIEAIAVINTAKAALSTAEAATNLFKAATQIAEFFPVLARVYDHLRLTEEMRKQVNDLQVLIGGALLTIRGAHTANQFIELAQIAADVLKSIPISDDPELQEAVITLHEGLDALTTNPPNAPPPVTEVRVHSSTSSSTTSTDSQMQTADNANTFKIDLRKLKRHLNQVKPPTTPEMFHVPDTFQTSDPKNNNSIYGSDLIHELWETSDPEIFRYQNEDFHIAQLGPPHRPLFICKHQSGPVIWAATKKALVSSITNLTYKGLTDSEDEA